MPKHVQASDVVGEGSKRLASVCLTKGYKVLYKERWEAQDASSGVKEERIHKQRE
jgi:hypothetical protein